MALIGHVGSEKKIFWKVWTTNGRTTDHGHPISSPCQPHGSGELIRNLLQVQPNFPTLGLVTYINICMWYLPILEGSPYFSANLLISNFKISLYNVYISLFEINNFLFCLIILPISKSKSPYMASQMYHMYDINKQKERKVPAKLLLYNWVLYSVLNAIIISYPKF